MRAPQNRRGTPGGACGTEGGVPHGVPVMMGEVPCRGVGSGPAEVLAGHHFQCTSEPAASCGSHDGGRCRVRCRGRGIPGGVCHGGGGIPHGVLCTKGGIPLGGWVGLWEGPSTPDYLLRKTGQGPGDAISKNNKEVDVNPGLVNPISRVETFFPLFQ